MRNKDPQNEAESDAGTGEEPEDIVSQFERLESTFKSATSMASSGLSGDSVDPLKPKQMPQLHSFKKDSFWSWIACLCAFANMFFIFGTLNVYSLFLVHFMEEFKVTSADAAWLGSITMGLLKLFGPISSSLVMRWGIRFVMMLGAFLCSVSVMASSFSPDFQTLFATLCVPYALGAAFAITPAMIIPVDYFLNSQSLAMGITASGSSFGTFVLSPLIQFLLEKFNWRVTFRIYAISLFLLIFLNILVHPRKRRHPFSIMQKPLLRSLIADMAVWQNRVYTLWVFSTAIVYFGYQTPNIFLASYAGFHGIDMKNASYVVMAMGGATTVSRLVTGKLLKCTLLNRLHFKQTIFVSLGTLYLLLPHITSLAGLYIFAILRGLLDGAHIVMLPTMTASMVGASKAMLGWGYICGAVSVTYALGPPAAGWARDYTGNYDLSFIMSGLPLIGSGMLLFLLPWAQRTGKTTNILAAITAEDEVSTSIETSSTPPGSGLMTYLKPKQVLVPPILISELDIQYTPSGEQARTMQGSFLSLPEESIRPQQKDFMNVRRSKSEPLPLVSESSKKEAPSMISPLQKFSGLLKMTRSANSQ